MRYTIYNRNLYNTWGHVDIAQTHNEIQKIHKEDGLKDDSNYDKFCGGAARSIFLKLNNSFKCSNVVYVVNAVM